jgi:hypothetical protein
MLQNNNLDERIYKTKKVLNDIDTISHQTILENQIVIMETLKDIQEQLGRVKKTYTASGCGLG